VTTYARCPECGKILPTIEGLSDQHVRPDDDGDLQVRSGSGWLVEDEDVVPGRWPR